MSEGTESMSDKKPYTLVFTVTATAECWGMCEDEVGR